MEEEDDQRLEGLRSLGSNRLYRNNVQYVRARLCWD